MATSNLCVKISRQFITLVGDGFQADRKAAIMSLSRFVSSDRRVLSRGVAVIGLVAGTFGVTLPAAQSALASCPPDPSTSYSSVVTSRAVEYSQGYDNRGHSTTMSGEFTVKKA